MPHIPAQPLLTSASPQDNPQNHAVLDLDSVSLISFFWSPLTLVFSFYYCFDSYPGYLTKVTQGLSCLLHEIADSSGHELYLVSSQQEACCGAQVGPQFSFSPRTELLPVVNSQEQESNWAEGWGHEMWISCGHHFPSACPLDDVRADKPPQQICSMRERERSRSRGAWHPAHDNPEWVDHCLWTQQISEQRGTGGQRPPPQARIWPNPSVQQLAL